MLVHEWRKAMDAHLEFDQDKGGGVDKLDHFFSLVLVFNMLNFIAKCE